MNQKSEILSFSEDFIKLEYVENSETYTIKERTIIVNLGKKGFEISEVTLKPFDSAIYSNIELKNIEKLLFITMETELFSDNSFAFSNETINSWKKVYEIFPISNLKHTKLWRSDKERIGNIELNLWFASAGTNCGIHNEHNFREMHTQIFGLGRIQKFHTKDFHSLYQDIYLCPGYTHDPLCNEKKVYPYHQYYADTDCLWLAIEIYE